MNSTRKREMHLALFKDAVSTADIMSLVLRMKFLSQTEYVLM
jgi:hypothetical protein